MPTRQTLRLYDTYANSVRTTFTHEAPLLDACFSDGSHAVSGGLDCQVRYYDLNANNETVLGAHAEGVRQVVFSPEQSTFQSRGKAEDSLRLTLTPRLPYAIFTRLQTWSSRAAGTRR